MSARLRSLPWWERCEDFFDHPWAGGYGMLAIPRLTLYAGLGRKLELQGPVNPQAPDGIFFATCGYCITAAYRRMRLALPKMVIIMDYDLPGDNWAIVELRSEPPFDVRYGFTRPSIVD